MQTVIDIPEEEITRLDKLSQERQVPREELVRAAISNYVKAQTNPRDAAFGLWAHKGIDGLEYQLRMRDEWER
jgi:metal-responsive CopG/Arc/MetJ family transcriptional regulator